MLQEASRGRHHCAVEVCSRKCCDGDLGSCWFCCWLFAFCVYRYVLTGMKAMRSGKTKHTYISNQRPQHALSKNGHSKCEKTRHIVADGCIWLDSLIICYTIIIWLWSNWYLPLIIFFNPLGPGVPAGFTHLQSWGAWMSPQSGSNVFLIWSTHFRRDTSRNAIELQAPRL